MTRRFYLENSYLINLNNWLMCKKKILVDSYPEAMSYKQLMTICRRKISLSQGKGPLLVVQCRVASPGVIYT